MPSSKNPFDVIDVPLEIIKLASQKSGIVCNLRLNQQPIVEGDEGKKRCRAIEMALCDTWNFYEKMKDFLKTIKPGTRLILVCQSFRETVFSFVRDIEDIYWADGCYPRINFRKKPRAVQEVFGHSNLWGGFILAAAKVGRIKEQAELGYNLLFEIAKRPDGIIN
jgi:hypothetical protein